MDYQGAIEEFERALDVNPRSAAAHYELGILLGEKAGKPAAAIYHYEKYLELRPGAGNADIVQQQIMGLKLELTKGLTALSSTPEAQQQINLLIEENRRLKEELERWRTGAGVRNGAGTESSPAQTQPRARTEPTVGRGTGQSQTAATNRPATTRTYRVETGDTPASIARKYRISADALLAANPGLNPRRLQVGQSLNIP